MCPPGVEEAVDRTRGEGASHGTTTGPDDDAGGRAHARDRDEGADHAAEGGTQSRAPAEIEAIAGTALETIPWVGPSSSQSEWMP